MTWLILGGLAVFFEWLYIRDNRPRWKREDAQRAACRKNFDNVMAGKAR